MVTVTAYPIMSLKKNICIKEITKTFFQQATAELQEAFKRPEAIPALCEITVSSKESQHRQYSAVLLTKRLGKLRNWQLVPVDQQEA